MIPIGLDNEAVYHKISILGGNCISTEWATNHSHSQGLRIFEIISAFTERINQFHSSFSFSRGSCVRVKKAISGVSGKCNSESGLELGNNELIFKNIIMLKT